MQLGQTRATAPNACKTDWLVMHEILPRGHTCTRKLVNREHMYSFLALLALAR